MQSGGLSAGHHLSTRGHSCLAGAPQIPRTLLTEMLRVLAEDQCQESLTVSTAALILVHGDIAAEHFHQFLANVNSRSREHVHVRVRYMLSPVRLSVVCQSVMFVRPTQAVQILGNISMVLGTLAIH